MIRLFNHYLPGRLLLLTLVEAAVLFQAVVVAHELRFLLTPLPLASALAFVVVMLASMTALGLYETPHEPFRTTVQRVLVACVVAVVALSLLFYLVPETHVDRGVLAFSALLAVAGVLAVRLLFVRLTDAGLPRRRVLVLGGGTEAQHVMRVLHDAGHARTVQHAALCPVDADGSVSADRLRAAMAEHRASEIVLAVGERRGGKLPLRELLECRLRGVLVMDLASFHERETGQLPVDQLRVGWLIHGDGFGRGLSRDILKRIFDVAVSTLLLAAVTPLLLLTVLAMLADDGRPLLYRQVRVGQGGRPFTILKLRTMVVDAERDGRPRWAGAGDARITRIGRWLRRCRIDELPQLWNVLRGDMSFVGPRPERPFFVEQLRESIPYYDVRHSVKPGLTGWAQVRYAYGASAEDALAKLRFDLYYVKNHSLFLDLLILIETLRVVLLGKGAR